jgi:hypothetical protein
MKDFFKKFAYGIVGLFAVIGFVFTAVFVGMQFGIFNVRGSSSERNSFFDAATSTAPCLEENLSVCAWNETPEWKTVSGGLQKDAPLIARASRETGVPARLIAAVVVPEQLRFFTSEREIFKSYFEPLKILGSLTQFSLGVSGIKQETAAAIEMNAAATSSPLYPGNGMAELIAYTDIDKANHDDVLYNRLTDPKNHYYSYLYTALYIKEVEAQWSKAGYDISKNAAVVTTLFNIGFANSKPNASPGVGGAQIEIGGKTYLFGELGADFYSSGELLSEFP